MTYYMASLIRKLIRGKPYYYARECKRIDGKPKIVWQKYLGRADDIIATLTTGPAAATPPQPREALVADFGAVVALYDLATRLHLVEFIDRHVRKARGGPSVGTYLLVAALNRCVAPCSKAGIAEWFQSTVLRRLLPIEARQLSSQRFWDNMDRVSREAITAIEQDLTVHLVREFDLDLQRVLFDATNFFTFIDTFNERCTVAQRGKSKEGRRSLRIVGLALLVSSDSHVPLLHRTYPGNQPDAPTFASLTEELVKRYRQLTDGAEHVTMIFDKGNNSHDNLDAIKDSPYHFVGSLVPTQHPELLKIPEQHFHSLAGDGFPAVRAYRTTKKVFGVVRTILVTYNENLFVAQSQTLLREIAKRQQRLRQLQLQLNRRRAGKVRGGQPPTVAGTKKKVDGWLKARHMNDLFAVEITEQERLPTLTYRFDKSAWERLQKTLLGKNILFTDNDDWTDAEIVHGYRSQHHVESAFRSMKDPMHICLRPQHHWTDQKIEVHVFYCVLALTLCSLLRRELHQRGIDRSIPDILDQLAKIREVSVVFAPQGRKRIPIIKTTLSTMTEDQKALYDALDLSRYLSA
jgi:transposase